jgi:hypothetical protein
LASSEIFINLPNRVTRILILGHLSPNFLEHIKNADPTFAASRKKKV